MAAVDYGIERFSLHATRFGRMCAIAEDVTRGAPLDELQRVQVGKPTFTTVSSARST